MAPTVPIDFTGQKESRKFSLSHTMGKSKKHSKSYSACFVPDYQHAVVETMGESEGFGSSGQVDIEITAESISLNVDGYDNFKVPMQVLSLSKILPSEKRNLESRLKLELEQVRLLQKKICSLTSSAVLSPSSDVKSCSDGIRRPALENNQRHSEISAPRGKKRASPPGHNEVHMKKGTTARFEPLKQVGPVASSNAVVMKQCETLLKSLMSHQFGWVFNTPVDVVKLNIPDYFVVIKHPMDLGTVKSKLMSAQYSRPLEFAADVRLTFSNAMTYNPPGNDVHFMAATLNKSFESRWKSLEKKFPGISERNPVPSGLGVHFASETAPKVPPLKKKKITLGDNEIKPGPPKQIMTEKEKINLSTELEALQGEFPDSIVDFLKEQSSFAGQACDEEVEIDLDALSDETLFKLRKLLDAFLLEKPKTQAKAEACELELLNEPGYSTSSLQPCKGNEAVDEDIDIVGGNDPLVSSYPPVEIEKDAIVRNSKCSSSSSSSSDSGSSSSDSGSSSGSESVGGKSIAPKVNIDAGADLDKKHGQNTDPGIEDKSANGLGQLNQNPETKLGSTDVDDHQDGESTPLERQVSPEKLYRAALLRNRFADTILKAREKALEKDEKRDPEKLRLEREELERRQREEKARLQAEAKAAEEARKKAEAEATAEALRQRELEREAARQKLQEMEKTVDINENSQFLQDLEMLQAASIGEELPNFTEEASPVLSQNPIGSFKLQGSSNPLEQLGLFMRNDEDDEEEEIEGGEPPPSKTVQEEEETEGDEPLPKTIQEQPTHDVEDGEID